MASTVRRYNVSVVTSTLARAAVSRAALGSGPNAEKSGAYQTAILRASHIPPTTLST
jgi:hypothetical protein